MLPPNRARAFRKRGGSPVVYVGAAVGSLNQTSVSVPTHSVGDLILVFAYSNTTIPSLPPGYTNVATISAGVLFVRIGYKIATATNDGSGTWSNAIRVNCSVYNSANVGNCSTSYNNSGSANETYPALTLSKPSYSWVTRMLVHDPGYSNPGTPSGYTARALGTNGIISDTNAPVTSAPASENIATGSPSALYVCASVEITPSS